VEQINEETYAGFYDMVPIEYQTRLDRLGGFDYLLQLVPENPHRYIDVDTFGTALDVWAQMHVENCDIQFKVIKKVSGNNQVQQSVEILSRTKTFGYYVSTAEMGVFKSVGAYTGSPSPNYNFDADRMESILSPLATGNVPQYSNSASLKP